MGKLSDEKVFCNNSVVEKPKSPYNKVCTVQYSSAFRTKAEIEALQRGIHRKNKGNTRLIKLLGDIIKIKTLLTGEKKRDETLIYP